MPGVAVVVDKLVQLLLLLLLLLSLPPWWRRPAGKDTPRYDISNPDPGVVPIPREVMPGVRLCEKMGVCCPCWTWGYKDTVLDCC